MAKDRMHVALFPWLAFGHMIPYLNLSKFIAQRGHRVSFISSRRNIDRLPKLPLEFASSISFVKIRLPRVEHLPENAEATMDIRNEETDYLKKAYDGLEPELTRFLEHSALDWIIYDFAPYWLPPIAARLGISRAFFHIMNSWFLSFFGPVDALISGSDGRTKIEDYMVPPEWVKFNPNVAFRRFEADWVMNSRRNTESGTSDFLRVGKVIEGSEAILMRDCRELSPEWLGLLEEIYKIPIVPVGLMQILEQQDVGKNDGVWGSIKHWLDGHSKGSVVYVALGSEVNSSQDQLNELALGLDLSGVTFFWVLRSEEYELPSGFKDRVRGRGIVWRDWVPQSTILSHDSVGGFLTHCGWGSVVEGLTVGHPLITLPFFVDQGLNSRVIVEKKLGIEIPRNEGDGSYTSDSVAKSIKVVMLEREGKIIREKAKDASLLFGDKQLQDRYADTFVTFLQNHKSVYRMSAIKLGYPKNVK